MSNVKNGGNCQAFVESVLEAINVKINFTGPLAKYLVDMREKGASKLSFQVEKDFQKKFKLKSESTLFETHTKLDQFTRSLFEVDSEFDVNYKDEYQLLKSFDRAFWMRFYKKKERIEKILKQIETLENGKFTPMRKKQVEERIRVLKEKIDELDLENEKDCPCSEKDCPFSDPLKTKSFRY
jgi:hypothetical protein